MKVYCEECRLIVESMEELEWNEEVKKYLCRECERVIEKEIDIHKGEHDGKN